MHERRRKAGPVRVNEHVDERQEAQPRLTGPGWRRFEQVAQDAAPYERVPEPAHVRVFNLVFTRAAAQVVAPGSEDIVSSLFARSMVSRYRPVFVVRSR